MASPSWASRHSVAACCVLWSMLALTAGCSNQMLKRPGVPVSLEPPPAVAAPAATLPPLGSVTPTPLPSYADVDPRQLQTTLARNQDENQLLKDEITALREQLASTSSQLALSRSTAAAAGPWSVPGAQGGPGGFPATPMQPPGGAPVTAGMAPSMPGQGPAAMLAAMGQVALPGIEKRFDGNVVRLEVPADRLFEGGSAALLPGGSALLTQVAGEIDRLFPKHFIGIEGHVDTEPVSQSSWASPHQLTAARATTVFDFFTTRTSLRQGQLFLVAHGANHPVVSNATAAGRTRNRRIELVIYPERIGNADTPASDTP